jgi:RimJ/RimL family protein N-acetyltransferase
MIEYDFIDGPRGSWKISVKLDGKIVGAIKLVEGGFAYFPKGSRKGFATEVFKSVREVQRSLETVEE